MKKFIHVSLIVTLTVLQASAQQSFSLKECIQYGLDHHPSVTISQNNAAKANAQAAEAVSGYLPQVNVNASFDDNIKLQTSIIPAGALSPTETRVTFGNPYGTTVVAQLDQPIYNQALIAGIKANKPNRELAMLTENQTKQTIIYNIASAYYQVITAQKQVQLLQTNKDRMEKLFQVAQLQANTGTARKVDAKQMQVNLNNVKSQLSVAENNARLTLNTLKNAMGYYTADNIVLSDTAYWLNNQQRTITPPAFQYTNTLDYRMQEKQIELYGIQAKNIRAGGIPSLSAYARYGMNGFGTDMDKAVTRQFDYSAVGLKLNMPIFTGFRRNSQYQQAIITRDNARLTMDLNKGNQQLQFENAQNRFLQAQSTLEMNKENLDLANEVYDNASLQYKNGVASMSDLLNAESSYTDAQNNYIQSLISYYVAQLDLEKSNSTLDLYFNKL